MKSRKWSSSEKLQIVLEGLKATVPLAELCIRHQITWSQYYQWRDRLLQNGDMVFVQGGSEAGEERLRWDNLRLKALIGELTVELKKTTGRGYEIQVSALPPCSSTLRGTQGRLSRLEIPPHLVLYHFSPDFGKTGASIPGNAARLATGARQESSPRL